ncbi:MAG TPA: glycosyltransferase family 39 protein [Terriglobales bacterium]|nr:glycosyltransferase family 39 protein [Terriglobales bacterium]
MPEIQEIPTAGERRWQSTLIRIDHSVVQNANRWSFLLLAAGFLVRIWHASGTFLNSDEVMHFAAANQNSWSETYKISLAISHPPLLIFVEHIWRYLGTSELMLRMPSILAGLVFCWFTFHWARTLFSEGVAWTIYVFTLFLPSSIELSTEIRQYALFLAFAMASAYLLERALARNCATSMLLSGASLWLAIGSHFSAFLFAPALGIYAIWRMITHHPSWRVFAAWIAGQVVALGLCIFLYITQIRRLSQYFGGQDATQGWMGNAYLSHSYYVPGRVNPLLFIIGRTIGVFQYVFRQLAVGDVAFLFFIVGLILVFRGRPVSTRVTSRQLGCFLLLPFAINCAAALVRAYPYGGTRHSCFLLPFALAGVSVALDRLLKYKLVPGIATAVVLSVLCHFTAAKELPYVAPDAQGSAHMRAAMQFVHQLPADEPIFGDVQTDLLLGHYLCDQKPFTPDRSIAGFVTYECGGHRVIASTTRYIFTARTFYDEWQQAVTQFHLRPGSTVWVAQMGWYTYVAFELANFPEFHLQPHYFGPQIQIFDLIVGQNMPDPGLLPTK